LDLYLIVVTVGIIIDPGNRKRRSAHGRNLHGIDLQPF
jgi:hypothetical protein